MSAKLHDFVFGEVFIQNVQRILDIDHLYEFGSFFLFEDEPSVAVETGRDESVGVDLASDNVFTVAESYFKTLDDRLGACYFSYFISVYKAVVLLEPTFVQRGADSGLLCGWVDGKKHSGDVTLDHLHDNNVDSDLFWVDNF